MSAHLGGRLLLKDSWFQGYVLQEYRSTALVMGSNYTCTFQGDGCEESKCLIFSWCIWICKSYIFKLISPYVQLSWACKEIYSIGWSHLQLENFNMYFKLQCMQALHHFPSFTFFHKKKEMQKKVRQTSQRSVPKTCPISCRGVKEILTAWSL